MQTGGPEALHQLVDGLRRVGVDAWLWPLPDSRRAERVADYERYDAPETTEMMDEADTVVVLAETSLHFASRWERAKIFCWWLSIDWAPYFHNRRLRENAVLDGARPSWALLRSVVGSHRRVFRDRAALARMTHLTQSRYAWNYIRRALRVSPTMLGDYVPDADDLHIEKPDTLSIAFNPLKGKEITDQIRELSEPSLTWLPIRGLSREGVSALLDRATVYLETGHQPGKDRIPREAALHGCVILMVRKGAGRNRQDSPLADEYKIQPGRGAARRFTTELDHVLADAAHHRAQQQPYLDMVLSDRSAFDRAVKGIFLEGRRGVASW
jgi:hypothetical protein